MDNSNEKKQDNEKDDEYNGRPSMYGSYSIMHDIMQDDEDPITLQTVRSASLESLLNSVMKDMSCKNIEAMNSEAKKIVDDKNVTDDGLLCTIRTGNKLTSYNIQSAYETYVTKNTDFDILTNIKFQDNILKVLRERITLYKKFNDTFPNYKCDKDRMSNLFVKFLDSFGNVSGEELLELKRWIVFDISDTVFSSMGTRKEKIEGNKRMEFRNLAQKEFEQLPANSWIIRPSSIDDVPDKHMYVRAISVKTKVNKDNVLTVIQSDILVIHFWGLGYITTGDFKRGDDISNVDFNKITGNWYPTLIDVILGMNLCLPMYHVVHLKHST